MEPLGIIVFSCIMGTAGFSVILEAVRQLIDHAKTELPYEGAVVGAPPERTPAPMPWTCTPASARHVCRGRGWPVCHFGGCVPAHQDTSRWGFHLWTMVWVDLPHKQSYRTGIFLQTLTLGLSLLG